MAIRSQDAQAKRDAIQKRRAQVADLRMGGGKQSEIAAILKVSIGTVNGDLKALRAEWRKTSLEDTEAIIALDLERTERMISSLWVQALAGNVSAIREVRELIRLRANVLGWAMPTGAPAAAGENVPPQIREILVVVTPESTTIDGDYEQVAATPSLLPGG